MNKQSTTSQADRQIKFRAWVHDTMYEDVFFTKVNNRLYDLYQIINGILSHVCLCDKDTLHLMQFTGLLDSNNKEVYEGDIRRETIEHNEGDETYYCVMVYIKEWSMFAWLNHTDGEYQKYLDEGAESLDTVMYWCYPAGQEKQEHVTVCGNIYANSNLLQG